MTRELRRHLKYWVKELQLGPPLWKKITLEELEVTPGEEVFDLGHCLPFTEGRTAVIKIASSEVHSGCGHDIEETLIHELLHLRLEGHREEWIDDRQYEAGLNVLAETLVRLRRAAE